MYPLAWVVVGSENEENWRWFMGLFKTDYDIIDGYKWTVISDQQKVMKYELNLSVFNLLIVIVFMVLIGFFFWKGLCNAIAHHMPNVERKNCAWHAYANWKKNWKGDEFKRLFWRAVNATNAVDYIEALDDISAKNNEATIHFVEKGPVKFCKSFFR